MALGMIAKGRDMEQPLKFWRRMEEGVNRKEFA